MIYLIGSLRNPRVPEVAKRLRLALKTEVFDDWYAAGPEADDCWQTYEQSRGHSYIDALGGLAARHVFEYDMEHLDRAKAVVLLLPAGKSAHMEFGYIIGQGKPGWILLDSEIDPERWDVMYQFANVVCGTVDELIEEIAKSCYGGKA